MATLETVARPAGVAARSSEREVLSGSLRRGSRHDGPTALAEADSAKAFAFAVAFHDDLVAVFEKSPRLTRWQLDRLGAAPSLARAFEPAFSPFSLPLTVPVAIRSPVCQVGPVRGVMGEHLADGPVEVFCI